MNADIYEPMCEYEPIFEKDQFWGVAKVRPSSSSPAFFLV